MITWDENQTICQDLSKDASAASLVFFKRLMNVGYKYILAQLGRQVTERTQTTVTVGEQQFYQMPPDFLFHKKLSITVGSTVYTPEEVESQEVWNRLNQSAQYSDTPQKIFIRPRFGIGGAEIGIYPIPSSDDNTITEIYEAGDKDKSIAAYTTGSVSVTNHAATVTGSGTTWITPMEGRYFNLTGEYGDDMFYKIITKSTATSIILENVYEGETAAAQNYQICEMFNLPEEMQILPCHYALWFYFSAKKDKDKIVEHKTFFDEGMILGKRRYAAKSRDSAIQKKLKWMDISNYPGHFPTSGVSS